MRTLRRPRRSRQSCTLTENNRYEKDLKPTSESTALEGDGEFQEYKAADKLKGKKALITGGE